ncbi:MAG TPA: hypothetical protein VFG10_03300 [Saprospiraceae bacterium]|nr:hypothetical protein [Saprospiraceae bacterium]
MKNTVSNVMSIKLALAGFILACLFLFAPSHIQAQTTNEMFSVPSGPYVTPAVAKTRVEAKGMELKNNYSILTHGSQAYNDNVIKHAFYSIILDKLNEGKTVKESLETGLKYFGTDAASTFTRQNMSATRLEAINLLKP